VNPSDEGDPRDRALLAFLEKQVTHAVAEANKSLERRMDGIERALFGDEDDPNDKGLVGEVKKLVTWLVGETSSSGEQTPGILQKVAWIWGARKFFIGCVTAVTVSVITIAVLQLWAFFFPGSHPPPPHFP
jgi:hypothetical protein